MLTSVGDRAVHGHVLARRCLSDIPASLPRLLQLSRTRKQLEASTTNNSENVHNSKGSVSKLIPVRLAT